MGSAKTCTAPTWKGKLARSAAEVANVERLIPQLADQTRDLVGRLETSLTETDVDRARGDLRALFGSINVVADEREVRLAADLRETRAALVEPTEDQRIT